MTFVVNRTGDKGIEVGITYGPITIKVQEDPGHLRSFWGQLGVTLEDLERSIKNQDEKEGSS